MSDISRDVRLLVRGGALGLAFFAALACDLRGDFELSERKGADIPVPPKTPTGIAAPSTFPASAPTSPPALPPPGAPQSFADLAERANPAVVFVRVGTVDRRRFRPVVAESSGSGFVFDSTGLILTNFHVVGGADAIAVELNDRKRFPAQVVGIDPLTDLAVLKIDAKDLPVLPLGDSDLVRVGDWAIAIGNPVGLSHTVSAGIISAKERGHDDVKLDNPRAYYSFLQTDASINPGNSGGPLLDATGRVIGINSAIRGDAQNIGFAIPINMVRELLPRLLKEGRVVRSALGVQVASLGEVPNPPPQSKGAFVAGVIAGGPAERAGLKAGDIVVRFDDHEIDTPERLRWRASLAIPEKPVSIEYYRGTKLEKVDVKPVLLER